MKLGIGSTGDNSGTGSILTAAKWLDELPTGSIIRNGCDSTDPPGDGIHLIKAPYTMRYGNFEWLLCLPGGEVPNTSVQDNPARAVDVFLPVQVVRHGDG